YEKITSQIKQVQEQQDRNQEDLRQHDQLEQDIHELNAKGKRLFNELSDTWGKDQRMALEVDQNKNELLYNERRIRFELEEKKENFRQQYQLKQDNQELNAKGKRLFNELNCTLGKDQRMALEFDQNKNELLYN